jgi:hypothetical protein
MREWERDLLCTEIVVSMCINIFTCTSEVFDQRLQLVRFTFPHVVLIESGVLQDKWQQPQLNRHGCELMCQMHGETTIVYNKFLWKVYVIQIVLPEELKIN